MPGKIYAAPANSNPDTEVEDTEESEEEVEDSEDTETENEEQSEEGEEEETDSEETEEEEESTEESDEEQYIDLKNVPAQLQIAAKKMMASHTKAMQKVAAQVEAEKER